MNTFIKELEARYYFDPLKQKFGEVAKEIGVTNALNYLTEIMQNCNSIKSKYDLRYETLINFKVGLITTNFYQEITNPQQQGMLRFFDFVYITKTGEWGNIVKPFSEIIGDINQLY